MILYQSTEIFGVCAISSVDRVPGYEPVGRRFESRMARHDYRPKRQKAESPYNLRAFCFLYAIFAVVEKCKKST